MFGMERAVFFKLFIITGPLFDQWEQGKIKNVELASLVELPAKYSIFSGKFS